MNIKECFEILELRVDATTDQVKKAYKKLKMVFHPDKVQGNPKLKMMEVLPRNLRKEIRLGEHY